MQAFHRLRHISATCNSINEENRKISADHHFLDLEESDDDISDSKCQTRRFSVPEKVLRSSVFFFNIWFS